jgi:protein translocase SecG subunit
MIIPLLQSIVAVAIIILILLQERSSGLSGIFGGDGGVYQTRRGVEKSVFTGTIVLGVVFVALALVHLLPR